MSAFTDSWLILGQEFRGAGALRLERALTYPKADGQRETEEGGHV